MTLQEEITNDWKQAFKAGEQNKKDILSFVRSEFQKKAKALRLEVLDDNKALKVIQKMAKEQRDFCENVKDRPDLIQKAKEELAILESYLPQLMSEEEVKIEVDQVIEELDASAKDMGKVMGVLMKRLKGKADGSLVQIVVKGRLL